MFQALRSMLSAAPRFTTLVLGVLLTLTVLVLHLGGALEPLENWLYDLRVRDCQRFLAKPTDELMHVDIDDAALEHVGRWPWHRGELAKVLDELGTAGARTIALDILFLEPQEPRWRREADGSFTRIDDDAVLADAIARHGNVILAIDPMLTPPIAPLRDAAVDVGLVKYPRSSDGVSRFVSLVWQKGEERLIHLALQLAARQHGLDPHTLTVSAGRLRIDGASGLSVPVSQLASESERAAGLVDDLYVPWFGRAGADAWRTMFDTPERRAGDGDSDADRHYSILRIWEIAQLAHQVQANRAGRDQALGAILNLTSESPPAPDASDEALRKVLDQALADAREYLDAYDGTDGLTDDEKLEREHLRAAYDALDLSRKVQDHLSVMRAELRDRFAGKAVIVGFAATAAYDEVPTPLHPKAPGSVVHGALYNGIVTGELWTPAPPWVAVVLVIALGLAVTAIATFAGPILTAAAAVVLGVAYFLVNSYVVFDAGDTIVVAGAPLLAVGFAWAGCTVSRFVLERLERARITRRFRSYVDPVLVDYVIDHPDQTQLDGEERDLTVVFTDLAGFTTLSEKLKADTVRLLSRYLEAMVPIVREHRGYLNKFLGDGMMFFYGAPLVNEGHAIDAVATVLRMQEALVEFNRTLQSEGLSTLAMRAGIGSGPMVVGDAGPVSASDYTVIGDTVNLAARLESANKVTGSWIMINQNARDLIGDRFLVRPIGHLRVVGRNEPVFAYEPLCRAAEATDAQRQFAQLTETMVRAYLAADFTACMQHADELENRFEAVKLTALYRDLCRRHLTTPPGPDFTGVIVLVEK